MVILEVALQPLYRDQFFVFLLFSFCYVFLFLVLYDIIFS